MGALHLFFGSQTDESKSITDMSSSSTPFHLGNVTHADWFESNIACAHEEHSPSDVKDHDEDCEDMDMDS